MRKLLLSLFTVVAALSMANAGEVTFDLTKPDLFGFAGAGCIFGNRS